MIHPFCAFNFLCFFVILTGFILLFGNLTSMWFRILSVFVECGYFALNCAKFQITQHSPVNHWYFNILFSFCCLIHLLFIFLQNTQSGPQPQSLYHSGPLSAPTPPNMAPGHTSPQGSYPIQGYSIHSHQGIPQTYPLSQLAQVWLQCSVPLK